MKKNKNTQDNQSSVKSNSKNNFSSVFLEIKPYMALILFSIFTLIFFNAQLGNSYFWEDFTEYVLPHQTYAANEFAKGYIPFWNNFSFAGMPFMADLQVGFFYPLNRVLNLFLSNGKIPVGAIEFVIIIHFVIAQFNFWLLNKSFGASSLTSIIGAVTYSFSMLMVCHVIHPMMVYHLAWFPLVLMFFRNALIGNETLKNLRYSIFSGLIFGFSILSGHPQTMLYISLFLFFVFVFYLIKNIIEKSSATKLLSICISSAIPIIIGIGIFTIQLLPSLELAKESRRNDNTIKLASEGSLQASQLFSMFNPDIYGKIEASGVEGSNFYLNYKEGYQTHYYWETVFYFGLVALVLGLFYFITDFKNKDTIFLILIAFFSILYALGSNGFLFPIFYKLPYFGTFRNPGRILFFLITAISLASSLGLEKLLSNKNDKSKLINLLVAVGLPLIILILISSGSLNSTFDIPIDNPEISSFVSSSASTSLFILVVIGIILFVGFKGIINSTITTILLVLVAFFDLYAFGHKFNSSPNNPMDTYAVDERLLSSFKVDTENKPNELFRVNSRMYNPSYMALPRNIGLMENIMLMEGYNPLVLERVHPPVGSREGSNDLQNVKYEIGIDNTQNAPRFYDNTNNMGFVWFTDSYTKVDGEKITEFLKSNSNFNFESVTILEKDISNGTRKVDNKDKDLLIKDLAAEDHLFSTDTTKKPMEYKLKYQKLNYKILKYNSEFMEVEVNAVNNGLAVFSEVYYPAIKVTNNGQNVELLRANYSLRAVEVKKGKNHIIMTYKSDKFTTGSYITSLTLLFSVLLLAFTYKDKFKK
jgi:hypothetical protein